MNYGIFRWSLLLVPAYGFFYGWFAVIEVDASFAWLSLLSLLACAALLSRLGRPLRSTLWAWVILGVFLQGYFAKTFVTYENVSHYRYDRVNPELNWLSAPTIAEGYRWIVLSFVVFCVTSCWVLGREARSAPGPPRPGDDREVSARAVVAACVGVFLLAIVAALMQVTFRFGVMGVENQRLPLRLDTLVNRYRSDVAPFFLLLGTWCLQGGKSRRGEALLLGLLGLLMVADFLVTTSRGSLVRLGLPLFLLWVLTGHLTRRRFLIGSCLVLFTILAYPFITNLRYLRMTADRGLIETLSEAAEILGDREYVELALNSGETVKDRVIGAEGVWFALGQVPDRISLGSLYDLLVANSLTVYYTRSVVGVIAAEDYRAPGLVGAFMLIGGLPAVVVLWAGYVMLVAGLWGWLSRRRIAPVALAMCTIKLLIFTSEGTLAVQDFASLLITVMAGEWVYNAAFLSQVPARGRVRRSCRPAAGCLPELSRGRPGNSDDSGRRTP